MDGVYERLDQIGVKNKDASILFLLAIQYGISPDSIRMLEDDVSKLRAERLYTRELVDSEVKYVPTINIPLPNNNLPDLVERQDITDDQIEQYRELFRGIKLGSMGNRSAVKAKLLRWISEHPEYEFGDIIEVTKYYISRTEPKFTKRADYFIYKREGLKKEEESLLETIIEEWEGVQSDSVEDNLI